VLTFFLPYTWDLRTSLFFTWVTVNWNRRSAGKIWSSRNWGYSSGLREENYFPSELFGVSKHPWKVWESRIPVSKFLASVEACSRFSCLKFLICQHVWMHSSALSWTKINLQQLFFQVSFTCSAYLSIGTWKTTTLPHSHIADKHLHMATSISCLIVIQKVLWTVK